MNKTIGFLVLSLAVGSLSQGAPTIGNPCAITSNQPPEYNSMPEQIRLALHTARAVNSTFQGFKNALRPVLISSSQCDLVVSLDNTPGLPLIHESNITTLDVLAGNLRRNALNITILYNLLEQLLNGGRMQAFNPQLRNVTRDILTVKCKILTTYQIIALNFTMEESARNNETLRADYNEFNRLQAVVSQGIQPGDEKSANCRAYTIARWVQRMMSILVSILEAEQRFMEIQ